MPHITIKKSTRDAVAQHALGDLSMDGCVFHNNGTVTVHVDDEVNDILRSRIDDITPTIDDVLVQLCSTGEVAQ